jgi:signal transduction histidine kinase
MKLLSVTTKYFIILIFSMLLMWCVVLYFSLRWTTYIDLDEHLNSRQYEILKTFDGKSGLVTIDSAYKTDYKIQQITASTYNAFIHGKDLQQFEDIKIYDELEKEKEFFREMKTVFIWKGNYYKLSIITSLLNSEELLMAILLNILFLFIMLLALIVLINRVLLPQLWKPFYETILQVKKYRLDKEAGVELLPTNIVEFQDLNHSIEELIQNNLKVFISQKQFIENASHEMQTPLGIIQNKVYMLMEEPALTHNQAALIDEITVHIDRLSRLNKSLLLLSKIENNQFAEIEVVDVNDVITSCCEDFRDLIEFKHIELKIERAGNPMIKMNPDLARILFSNLIKNAINHNLNNGFITLSLTADQCAISNSGKELGIDPELLFERFNKKSDSSNSNGLGLAIVRTICEAYGFTVLYKATENVHTISMYFKFQKDS